MKFILILLPVYIISHQCGLYPPETAAHCFNRDPKRADKCCLFTSKDKLEKFCYLLDESEYYEGINEFEVDDVEYDVECDTEENENLLGYRCGPDHPKSRTDCSDSSKKNNPCCLYNNTLTNTTECFFIGNLVKTSLMTYDKSIINCSGSYIYGSLITFIYFIIINL